MNTSTSPVLGETAFAGTDNFSSAMSVEEFSNRYGIGRSKVYLENKAGRLKFRKVGTRTLIMEGDAQSWAQSLPEAKSA